MAKSQYQFNFNADVLKMAKDFVSKKVTIKVGVLGKSPKRPDQINAVKLASIHEFGCPKRNIPERSFIRKTAFNYSDIIRNDVISGKKILSDMIINGSSELFFNQLGIKMISYVIETFQSEGPGWKELSDRTIKRRKKKTKFTGENPANEKFSERYPILQDTGQMKRSIVHEVVYK